MLCRFQLHDRVLILAGRQPGCAGAITHVNETSGPYCEGYAVRIDGEQDSFGYRDSDLGALPKDE